MAAYATRPEMYQLALNSGAFTGIATADQDAALAAASEFADGYITQRFQLPLSAWGQDLKEAVSNIAAYRVMAVRGFAPEASDAGQLRERYEDAVKWLKEVANGQATPVNVADAVGSGTQAADEAKEGAYTVQYRAETTSEDTLFTKGGTISGGVGPPKPRGW